MPWSTSGAHCEAQELAPVSSALANGTGSVEQLPQAARYHRYPESALSSSAKAIALACGAMQLVVVVSSDPSGRTPAAWRYRAWRYAQ